MAVDHTPDALATLVTVTTYGSWLRGDRRGWIERGGRLHGAAPALATADRTRMKHTPYCFADEDLLEVGVMIGESLRDRMGATLLALAVESWHAHFVVGPTPQPIGQVVKCAKDAVRYGLRPGRPIWTTRYDKRWCFDQTTVHARVRYVERHNERAGLGPRPWEFIEDWRKVLAPGQ